MGTNGPTGVGYTTASQTITLYQNGTTTYSPTTTVTYTLSNQQYGLGTLEGLSSYVGTSFGSSINSSSNSSMTSTSVYQNMNGVSGPSNSMFSACNACGANTGIDVTTNKAISIFNSADALINSSGINQVALNSRVYYADLTLTFNRPVSNPVVHIVGMGGFVNYVRDSKLYHTGFSAEMDLASTQYSIGKLDGNSVFQVSGNQINNSATWLGSSSQGATDYGVTRYASTGSVVVYGTNITSVTFKIYLRGDGGRVTYTNGSSAPWGSYTPAWSIGASGQSTSGGNVSGDRFLVGVSLQKPVTVSGNVFNDPNGGNVNNSTGTTNFVPSGMYANLVDANGEIVSSSAVSTNGTYSITGVGEGTYSMWLSTTQGTQGQTAPAVSLPNTFQNTGEYNGTPNGGSDGTIDGKSASFTVSSSNITNINFGIKGPEVCDNGIDDDGDGLTDCDDADCGAISITNVSITGCIDQPFADVATLTVTVSWLTPTISNTIEVSILGKTEYINTSSTSSPANVTFQVPADGSTNNAITANFEGATCSDNDTYNAPASCSSDELKCSMLYICGDSKGADADAFDHGLMAYIDGINGNSFIQPALAKNVSGMGLYDVNNTSTLLSLDIDTFGIILVSATTWGDLSSTLKQALRDSEASIFLMLHDVLTDLGMSTNGWTAQQEHAYTNNTNQEQIYNFNNTNPRWDPIMGIGNYYPATADAYLWKDANNQSSQIQGIHFHYDASDNLSGVPATHGSRTFLGYMMDGVYWNNDTNGGATPVPQSQWFDPIKHLTQVGKYYLDNALQLAAMDCSVEICGDGLDNDFDGLVDCADSDCIPTISNVSTTALSCPPGVYNGQIVIAATGSGTLSYSITNVPSYQSSNTFSNLGPGQYTIRVKNDAGCTTTYTASVVMIDSSNCVEICNDGIDNDGDGLVDCDDPDCDDVGNANTIDNN